MTTQQELRNQLLSRAADDESFRSLLLSDPKAAVKSAFGVDAPDKITIHVHEETSTNVHLVVPSHDQLSDEELEALSGAYGIAYFGHTVYE